MTVNRRHLITGLVSLVAAPAIVRIDSLMSVKPIVEEVRLVFYTTPRGDFPPVERMRITADWDIILPANSQPQS